VKILSVQTRVLRVRSLFHLFKVICSEYTKIDIAIISLCESAQNVYKMISPGYHRFANVLKIISPERRFAYVLRMYAKWYLQDQSCKMRIYLLHACSTRFPLSTCVEQLNRRSD